MKEKICNKLQEFLQLLALVYFFVMVGIFPFVFKEGYYTIGTDKFLFFRNTGFILICLLPFVCIYKIISRKKQQFSFSSTDISVLLYGIVVCLSYCFCNYKDIAFWGIDGWYMGMFSQLLFVVLYFFISRFFIDIKKGFVIIIMASFVIFFLGGLNRFQIYPIEMAGMNSGFISTIGNINWYSGYWAVLFPIGLGCYIYAEKWWTKVLTGIYCIVGFMTGITQGSDSGYLAMGAIYFLLFFVCCTSAKKMLAYLESGIFFCVVSQVIRVIRFYYPKQMNYETPLINMMTKTSFTLYAGIILIFMWIFIFVVEKRHGIADKVWIMIRRAVLFTFFLLCILFVLSVLYAIVVKNGRLYISDEFGSGRGAAWKASLEMFMSFGFTNRLIGVGSDCFSACIYNEYDGVSKIYNQFGDLVLTNAHNEWLTTLVNHGLWGLFSYVSIFVSMIYRCMKKKETIVAIFAVSIFSYMIHNAVSFQQVINCSAVFLVMGLAEAILRQEIEEESD